MDIDILTRQFARIGARLDIRFSDRPGRRRFTGWTDFVLDINEDDRSERFELTVDPDALDRIEMHALEIRLHPPG